MQYVPIGRVVVEPQVRKRVRRGAVEGIAKTYASVGLMSPLRVRRIGDDYVVVDGHLRLLAAKLAGFTSVPVIVEDGELSDAQVLERRLIANSRRENLRPTEFAAGIEGLLQATQWTASEVAERLGESSATISRQRALLSLPEAIRAQVDAGEISVNAAYKLTHVGDPVLQAQLAAELATGTLTRDELIDRLRTTNGTRAKPSRVRRAKSVTTKLPGGRTITFAGPKFTSVAELVEWLEELLMKARSESPDTDVPTFLKRLKQVTR